MLPTVPLHRPARSLLAAAAALLLILAVASLSRPLWVSAQDATPAPTGDPATLRVVGNGEVNVVPDTASISLGVDITAPTLAEAQAEATSQMEAVISAVSAAAIADEDIQTAYFSINPIRAYNENGVPGPVEAFQVSNQVTVQVRDLDGLSSLLESVVAEGANSIYGISFYIDDPAEAVAEARALAVEDATAKANGLAADARRDVGEILAITEVTYVAYPYGYEKGGGQAGGGPPIQPGVNGVTVQVEVTYELK